MGNSLINRMRLFLCKRNQNIQRYKNCEKVSCVWLYYTAWLNERKVQLGLWLEFTDIGIGRCAWSIIPSPSKRTVRWCPIRYIVHQLDAIFIAVTITWLIWIPISVGNIHATDRDKFVIAIPIHTNPRSCNAATFQYLINFLVGFRVFWYGQVATTCTTIILSLRPNDRFTTKIIATIIDMKPVTRTKET